MATEAMSPPAEVDRSAPPVHLHIGDRVLDRGTGGTYQRHDPMTGEVHAEIPLAGASDVDDAVRTAHEAYLSWRRVPAAEKRRLLLRLADLFDENQLEFARTVTLDCAMPYMPVVPMVADWIRYYAGWADKLTSEVVASPMAGGEFSYTLAQPYGVIGVILTWNGPIGSIGMKVPAALAAGNTVVIKPPEVGPFGAETFARIVKEAGFPPGVVNVLPGAAEAGQALVDHPLVQKVTFTGGTATGKRILESCSASIKPVVLELGGKSANLVFEDADLDITCPHAAMMSVGFLSGQGCTFPTRLLVQRPIYDEVLERVTAIAQSFPIGDPWTPGHLVGPVISAAAVERILEMIEQAKRDGARLVTGGNRVGGELAGGYYIEPTIFADVDPSSHLAQNEVFGPVLAITPFDTEEEAIAIANGTPYGLAAYISTRDLARAHRVADELVAGEILVNGSQNLLVNRPFGGFGLSGMGKEGGRRGIEEFLRLKGVGMAVGTGGPFSFMG